MKHPSIEIDELLARWLSGEADAETIERLQQWIQFSDENAKYVAQFEQLWSAAETHVSDLDLDAAWNTIQAQKNSSTKVKIRSIYAYWPAVAAAITIAIVSWVAFKTIGTKTPKNPNIAQGILLQSGNDTLATTLQDGTKVVLQPHAVLRIDNAFGQGNRNVMLTGKAWFQTTHIPQLPFTVLYGTTKIIDIGTAFHVNTLKDRLEVIVTEGSVKIETSTQSSTLFKYDTARIQNAAGVITIHQPEIPASEKTSKNKILVFNKTELKKVIQLLNSTYNANVKLGNHDIENCKLTASFNNEELEVVLDLIRETFNLEIRRESGIIYMEGTGCQ
jgi:ferric-dicitrate binding protein FerR (iron transport regulator)